MKLVNLSDVASVDLSFDGVGIIQMGTAPSSGKVYIDDVQYGFTTPVEENISEFPTAFSLGQNYPNPFNPSTTIKYSISSEALNASSLQLVSLKIYDIIGREVSTLVNESQKSGNYEVSFNAKDLTSGVYFYTLRAGSFYESKKMILLK
jgi:hypothetical protein